jgi:hypothetical protein
VWQFERMDCVKLKALAGELRKGYWWQFANERMITDGKDSDFSEKSTADDDQLVKAASTCMECRQSATHAGVRDSVAKASDMKSFLKLIMPKIVHSKKCDFV